MTELDEIKRLVARKTQIELPEEKARAVLDRMRAEYPGKTFEERLEAIDAFPVAPAWLCALVTINETFFFRHPEQFLELQKHFRKYAGKDVQALCAAVSRGQEAFSVAIALAEALPLNVDFQVTGIDIDQASIQAAEGARYKELEISRTPAAFQHVLRRHLDIVPTPSGPDYMVSREIRERVRFACANAFTASLARYDVIFVRNVLIYFPEADRVRLLARLREKLRPGGLLFIGAGEIFPRGASEGATLLNTSILERRAA